MVHEGNMDWLYAIPIIKLAITNSIKVSSSLSPVYIVYRTPIRIPVDILDGV